MERRWKIKGECIKVYIQGLDENILEKKCLDKRSFWQITSSIWQ